MATVLAAFEVAIAVGSIIKALYDFSDSAKGASKETRELIQELYALKGALEHIDVLGQDLDAATQSQVKDMLLVIKETLDLIGEQLHRSRKAIIKQSIVWPFKSSEVQKHLGALERAKTWLIMVLMKDMSHNALAVRDEVKQLTAAVHEDMIRKQTDSLMKETVELLTWLAPFNSDEMLAKATQTKMPGTGQWILGADLATWLSLEESKHHFFWIVGKSGSGKTTLLDSGPSERAFGYHCCSLENASSQKIPNIFGSVFAGVGRSHPDTLRLVSPYMTKGLGLVPENALDDDSITKILGSLVSEFRILYILVDALNETPQRLPLVKMLMDLCESYPQIRVLVTSTTEPPMVSPHLMTMQMTSSAVDLDIELYVQHRLSSEPIFEPLSSKIKDRVREKIVHEANGMFRWAKLGLDRLSLLRTGRDVLDALADMPTTLNGTYVGILQRIADHDKLLARETLLWMCFSLKPMTLRELAEAVVLREADTYIDDDSRLTNPQSLIEICQGLVVSEQREGFHHVILAHDSIRSFLTSESILSTPVREFGFNSTEAHSKIMRKCLTYLRVDAFASGPVTERFAFSDRVQSHPLLGYATFLWPVHSEQYTLSSEDEDDILEFFAIKGERGRSSFESWVQFLLHDVRRSGSGPSNGEDLTNIWQTEPLYYAASFNMLSILRILLRPELGVDLNRLGGRFQSPPLYIALWRGNLDAAAILLRAGADPDARDGGMGQSSREFARRRRMRKDILELMGEAAVSRQEILETPLGQLRDLWRAK